MHKILLKKIHNSCIILFCIISFGIYILSAEKIFAGGSQKSFSRTISIDLNGGSCTSIGWRTRVDRDGYDFVENQWLDNMGAHNTVLDRYLYDNTVTAYSDNENPKEGEFHEHADCIGVTPYVIIDSIKREGHSLIRWDTNTEHFNEDGKECFQCGYYVPDPLSIKAIWNTRIDVKKDSHVLSVEGDGEHNPDDIAHLTVKFDEGYMLDYVEDLDNKTTYDKEDEAYNWIMESDRSVKIVSKPITYTIVYHGNGGKIIEGHEDSYSQSCTYDETYVDSKFEECWYERDGYKFISWNKNADGSDKAVFKPGNSFRNLSVLNGATIDLYAQWKDVRAPIITVENTVTRQDKSEIDEVNIIAGKDEQVLKISAIDNESGMNSLNLKNKELKVDETKVNEVSYDVPKGSFLFEIVATDNAGNTSNKKIRVNVLSLTATIVNNYKSSDDATTFLRGDKGTLVISVTGMIDNVSITFPTEDLPEGFFTQNPNINASKLVSTYKQQKDTCNYTDSFSRSFKVIPLDEVKDGIYVVNVKATKGDDIELTANPQFTVNSSVLYKIQNEVKTYPKTTWK